ncbi:hypothetical protein Hanom_Chr03g00184921 [Helianthus anomalus]
MTMEHCDDPSKPDGLHLTLLHNYKDIIIHTYQNCKLRRKTTLIFSSTRGVPKICEMNLKSLKTNFILLSMTTEETSKHLVENDKTKRMSFFPIIIINQIKHFVKQLACIDSNH